MSSVGSCNAEFQTARDALLAAAGASSSPPDADGVWARVLVEVAVAVAELRRARFCDVMRIVVVGFWETEGMLGPRYSD